MEKVKPDMSGVRVVIRVNGFYDAKSWIYRMVQDGVAKCASCDKPAVSVFWQDQAEWYCECEEHATISDMWTGSTHWNPSVFTKTVIPELLEDWLVTLTDDERSKIQFENYDKTDWYAMLADRYFVNDHREVLKGTDDFGWKIAVFPLKDGQYAYNLDHQMGHTTWGYGLFAPYESIEAAVEDGRRRIEQGDF